jgi:hypothetical protein
MTPNHAVELTATSELAVPSSLRSSAAAHHYRYMIKKEGYEDIIT